MPKFDLGSASPLNHPIDNTFQMKSPIKLRIDIVEDAHVDGLSKTYSVIAWTFDRKTGVTLNTANYGHGYTYKEAHDLKRRIKNDFFG